LARFEFSLLEVFGYRNLPQKSEREFLPISDAKKLLPFNCGNYGGNDGKRTTNEQTEKIGTRALNPNQSLDYAVR